MVSVNVLLGSGKVIEEVKLDVPIEKYAPAWRYHRSCPSGKVIYTDKELAKLDAIGWVDHPGKINNNPVTTSINDVSDKTEEQ